VRQHLYIALPALAALVALAAFLGDGGPFWP
jgi:hypothetical protein